ncbi:hypothetical protein JOF53_003252 [Crossiella equi]|uniref:Integral membrane protein n=1 Tax=Crossiella equi TaxID=130796 RepID=A0ABS5ACS4_9PSEU|nr:hypothetical protein [Crossiella equi]MBP2474380.1 hypothetical protein [Crossiella equi]
MGSEKQRTSLPIKDVERWFLREGMPFVVRNMRKHPVLARSLPALMFFLGAITGNAAVSAAWRYSGAHRGLPAVEAGDRMFDDDAYLFTALGVSTVTAIGAAVLFLWLRESRRYLRTRTAGIVGAAVTLAAAPLAQGLAYWSWGDVQANLVTASGMLLIVYVFTRAGIGSLVHWAAWHLVPHLGNLGRLVTRAVPLLLLLVTFLFINTENWQMSGNLDRPRLWGIAWFFIAIIALFLCVRLPEELRKLRVEITPESVREACAGTELGRLADQLSDAELRFDRHPMKLGERLNVLLIAFVSQGMQIALLGLLVFLFFVTFGAIAIKDSVAEAWVGHPLTEGTFFTIPIPIEGVSNELIQVSIVMAAFSALYFAVYAINDAGYREQFFDEILTELQKTLLARECYLRLLEVDGPQSPEGWTQLAKVTRRS